jgi:hypothetical protein
MDNVLRRLRPVAATLMPDDAAIAAVLRFTRDESTTISFGSKQNLA